jgi:ketosteroid isomerase-like protein
MSSTQHGPENEAAVRKVIESWAAAVRRKDIPAILQNHSADFVMFDVPPPFQIKGIEAYRKSWDLFFSWSADPIPFDIMEMNVTAGQDVAFAVMTMRCAEPGADGGRKPLDFRLTVGLRKIGGQWTITHEHHSIPAVD